MHFLLIGFSMLDCRIYVHGILLMLSLFLCWAHNKHPFHTLAGCSPSILVGENIELGNRLLAQHSSTNSRRIDAKSLSQAYTHLGVLMHHNMVMSKDLSKSMNIFKGSRRYEYKENDPRVTKAEEFLSVILDELESGTFKHYPLPPPPKPRGRPKKRKQMEEAPLEEEVDNDYEDDIDELVVQQVEVEDHKKRKVSQRRSHQADTWVKMQEKLEIKQVTCICEEPWAERLRNGPLVFGNLKTTGISNCQITLLRKSARERHSSASKRETIYI